MNINEAFSQNLKIARQANCLTQNELASLSGLSSKYIYKLEKETANPSINVVNILAKTLGVTVISFFLDKEGRKIDFS